MPTTILPPVQGPRTVPTVPVRPVTGPSSSTPEADTLAVDAEPVEDGPVFPELDPEPCAVHGDPYCGPCQMSAWTAAWDAHEARQTAEEREARRADALALAAERAAAQRRKRDAARLAREAQAAYKRHRADVDDATNDDDALADAIEGLKAEGLAGPDVEMPPGVYARWCKGYGCLTVVYSPRESCSGACRTSASRAAHGRR